MTAFSGIDHAGIVVQDLAAAAAHLRECGFTVSGLTVHTALGDDGVERPVGAGQVDVVFKEGALEIMGIIDPDIAASLAELQNPYEGVNIVAFGTTDIQAARDELIGRGFDVDTPHPKRKRVNDGTEDRFAYMEFFGFPTDQTTEGYLIAVQQNTPARARPAVLKQHANGATALRGITLGAHEPQPVIDRYCRFFGVPACQDHEPENPSSATGNVRVGNQIITIRQEDGLSEAALVREITIGTTGAPQTINLTPVLNLRLVKWS